MDRVLKLIVTLTLLLFLAQAVVGVAASALAELIRGLVSSVASIGSLFGALLFVGLVAVLAVGLFARMAQFITSRDPRAARERAARGRAVHQRVRRPAEGVDPVYSHARVVEDSDPAIGEDLD